MTPSERALLQSLIDWLYAAADRAERSKSAGEAIGLRRAAAKFEDEFKRAARE